MLNEFMDPLRVLAVLCGLAFIPHSVAKFTSREAVSQVFEKSGFRPVSLFIWVALVIEIVATVALVLGIYAAPVAAVAGVFMLLAGFAAFRVSGGKWNWVLGGCEFNMFWAACLFIVALWG